MSQFDKLLNRADRARKLSPYGSPELHDLIDELAAALRAEREQWSKWNIAEIAVRNPSVMEYMKHWEGRAERAEAELEKLQRAEEDPRWQDRFDK
jgi:hypothetical protein